MSERALAALLAWLRGQGGPLALDAQARADLAAWLERRLGGGEASLEPEGRKAEPVAGITARSRALLFTDGASRGNPGPAALGFVVYHEGEELFSRGDTLGTRTNNQAEYEALVAGLAAVRELGFVRVEIAMDSELIVRQLEGRYKVKNAALKPLYEMARLRLTEFSDWSIRHVPRAENRIADALANEALDSL